MEEVYFGTFSIVRGKAVLTCSVLNPKTSSYSERGDNREHRPNVGACGTGLVLPERGTNTSEYFSVFKQTDSWLIGILQN